MDPTKKDDQRISSSLRDILLDVNKESGESSTATPPKPENSVPIVLGNTANSTSAVDTSANSQTKNGTTETCDIGVSTTAARLITLEAYKQR